MTGSSYEGQWHPSARDVMLSLRNFLPLISHGIKRSPQIDLRTRFSEHFRLHDDQGSVHGGKRRACVRRIKHFLQMSKEEERVMMSGAALETTHSCCTVHTLKYMRALMQVSNLTGI